MIEVCDTDVPCSVKLIVTAISSQLANIGQATQSRHTFSGNCSLGVIVKPHFSKNDIARVSAKIVPNLRRLASSISAATNFWPMPAPRMVSSTAKERNSTSVVFIGSRDPHPTTLNFWILDSGFWILASVFSICIMATEKLCKAARMLASLRGKSPPLRALAATSSTIAGTSSRMAGRI